LAESDLNPGETSGKGANASTSENEGEETLRILTFASLFPNKIDPTYGIFILQRTKHLAKRPGNEVIVVSPIPFFPRWIKTKRWRKASELPVQESVEGLTVHHPRYFLLPKIGMSFHGISIFLSCVGLLRRVNRDKRIDCIDAHFVYPDGFAAVLLGKTLDIPVTVSARGTDINVYPSYSSIRPMIRWTLREADQVVAVSGALKEAMVALGRKRDSIRLIPNGIDIGRFRYVERDQARKVLEMPANIPILVSVGALVPAKRHELLIESVAKLQVQHPNLKLFILGEGSSRSYLERRARELGVSERVQMPGKIPNEALRQWFAAADVSCLASAREGWPNVVTESLACGTPVVATSVGGVPEILHTPELGILVDGTSESVAQGIHQALGKDWNRREIADRTALRTWDTVGAEVDAILQESSQKQNQEKRK